MNIKIKNLSKTYKSGHKAIKSLDLEIGTGMFGLLGPNGAGKTTLMKIMTLMHDASEGTILFDDFDIVKHRREIRSILGYLPQDFRFFDKLKTWEYLDYCASLSGIKGKRQRSEKVDELLRRVGLFEVRERWANRMSGGMKRRLGIAQAIINDPKVIIVDEPTTGLDPEERIRFRNVLSEVSNNDTTIILSTHIVGDISSSCEDLALLSRGELRFQGSPNDLINLAKGKVWEVCVTDFELQKIKERFPIISTIPSIKGWEVQIIAEEISELGSIEGKEILPNIEHAYVYFMDYMLFDKMELYNNTEKINLFKA